MKWLLLVLVFQPSPDGGQTPQAIVMKSYTSNAECNLAGRNFRDIFDLPEKSTSFSVCISEDKFDSKDWDITGM